MLKKTISIVTPVYNSMRTFLLYMDAIIAQDYPHNAIEIVFADGGSTDGTLEAIEEFKVKYNINISVFHNQLKTAEAGKAVGVRKAKNDIICLLDSDNIIPKPEWLSLMMKPFEEEEIVASEPIEYTYQKEDSVINRYCALVGVNDPLCIFTGNYDRFCLITNNWTQMPREEINKGDYLSIKFEADMLPTIGANGFFMRKEEMLNCFEGDYLFDIDILYELLLKKPNLRIAKVKTGIIHLYCPDIKTFARKQKRRIKDFIYFNSEKGRKYQWNKVGKIKILIFALCTVTILPLILQAIIGFFRKKDFFAWAFHILACWITLWVYGWGTIIGLFKKEAMNRQDWKQ
jgi:glycosyltransferase involved in cell wall biosynthesis